eukprot:m.438370 g.438370  ORF g.438370 m.438370 type:complete len:411 (+) comp18228_c0_seq1:202-1434(+)
MRPSLVACATILVISLVAGQSTDFDVVLATPPTQDTHQYQLQNAVAVLISAGNVFYDADNDGIPLQAFEITDQDGNSLGPFEMPTQNFQDYIVDMSSVVTGVGLKPYHRGLELVNASDRGWRLDYYKDGISGSVYSTVLSGPITQVAPGVFNLVVDLQLRWSEEGDSLNRLGQGANSHIALALADFNSFTLTVESAGGARMVANLFSTTSTTEAPTSAAPNATPSPTAPPTASTTTTTVGPAQNRTTDITFEDCMDQARVAAQDRQIDLSSSSPKTAKKVKITPEERSYCEQFRSTCVDAKGKKKKGKKCDGKKGKIGLSNIGLNELVQRSTMIVAGAAAVVIVAAYVKVAQQKRIMADYETLEDTKEIDITPVAPTEIKAFVGHNPEDIYELAKTFHLPPEEVSEDVSL